MSKTPISSPVSFLPATEYFKYCDKRTVAQMVSDTGVDSPVVNLASDPNLAAALLASTGMLETALLQSNRYTIADMNALCGTPQVPTASTNTTGGTLATNNYGYRVTTTTTVGETLPSPEVLVSTTGSTSTVTLTWPAVSGNITGYKVYGRTPLAELFMASTTVPSFTDTGSITPSGALPTANTAGQLNASQGQLYRLLADITTWYLIQRRPDRKFKLPESYHDSIKMLAMLANGERIFSFQEVGNAGLLFHFIEQEQQVQNRNGIVWQAGRLFGKRSNTYPST